MGVIVGGGYEDSEGGEGQADGESDDGGEAVGSGGKAAVHESGAVDAGAYEDESEGAEEVSEEEDAGQVALE